MGELARIEEGRSLSVQQAKFVQALLDGASEAEALKLADYAETVLPQHVLRSDAVKMAIDAGCAARLSGSLKLKAMKALEALVEPGIPAATRFNAAKLIIEQNKEGSGPDGRSQTEMSIPELEALIARKEAELKDVTPDNGAHR